MTEIKIAKIIRSRRRTIALEIARDAQLIVRAPYRTPFDFIEKVVFKKRFWIKEKQEFVKERCKKIVSKEFVSGEGFLYLGEIYKLEIVDASDIAIAFNNGFQISRKYLDAAKEILIAWYKEQAYQKISERAGWHSSLSGLKYNRIKISDAQRRWGSCSAKGNLNFSWRLIMAPLRVIDYVVAHELAHLEEKNHSKAFWNKVKIMLPDYEQYRKWLKENRHLLDL
ncbi:MAG TPA: M48 family peptidase [Deltaproteobacteria bacterium]|nr:M48 family peptidase [Deltaproteobacteria bacterium]